jgi:hypothetical protein
MACQVRVTLKVVPQAALVVVLTTVMVILDPLQPSVAVGAPKDQAVPHSTVRSGAQVMTGAAVSTRVIVWLHRAVFPQSSRASHVRVALNVSPQPNWVVVLATLTLTAPQLSLAVGASKSHSVPHSTVRPAAHAMVGGVESPTVTVWLQRLVWPQSSRASHVRIALKVLPQPVLVTVLTMLMLTPPQLSLALGASKVHSAPHSTVRSGWQVMDGGVSTTVIVWLHVTVWPQSSRAVQVRLTI